jgi:hypothetical protein
MDLRFCSERTLAAKRTSEIQRRRGVTFRGNKIWEESEDRIIRKLRHLSLAKIREQLPYRSEKAIETRRRQLGYRSRTLKPWTTHEDRLLRAKIDTMAFTEIARLLPGRSSHAAQGRAWYLGIRKGCQRNPKIKGVPLYDEIRQRAHEDGLTMRALDRELKTGRYFQSNYKNALHWKKIASAVDFFGGRLTIDWMDA